ncbi:phosphatidate cytidylyltransferase [Candidatus Omnitrophota bacterium]
MGLRTGNLIRRLCSSAIILSLVYYVIFYARFYVFLLALEVFILVALYEFFTMVEKKGIFINKKLGLLFGGSLPLFFYFPGESIIIGATILSLFLINFEKKESPSSLINVAVTLLGILYVAWFFSFLAKIRCLTGGPTWVCFLILITKTGDAAAYFIGSKFGRLKLIKHISPNKTVEGAIAGLVVTILMALGSKLMLPEISFMQLGILGLCLGVLAQLGDLAESLIKRDVGVKDSGNIPGLGGVLDILDSILFTAPFLFYYLTAVLGI